MMRWLPAQPHLGVNLFSDPRDLKPGECVRARNLAPLKSGVLEKRGGLDRPLTGTGFGGQNTDLPVSAVMSPVPVGVSDFVVAARDRDQGSGVLMGMTVANTLTVNAVLPFDHPRVPLIPWAGKVYALPGPYAGWDVTPSMFPFYIFDTAAEASGSALTTAAFAGTGNDLVFPAIMAPYKSRLVLMNFGGAYRNTILFTDDFTATTIGDDALAANGRAINLVAGDDGDEIVAGIEVMLTGVGSPAEAGLLILRKYGTPFLLTGDMDQTGGGTSTLDIKRISIQTGCAGHNTVVRTPHGIIWAGVDDVWAFAGGVLPLRIGQKIKPALKLTPNHLQYRWSAAYFDGFYRLAVWGEGQGMALTDAPGDQWWLDLEDGLPQNWREARWWGPQQFLGGAQDGVAPRAQTWGLMAETRTGKDPYLYYVDRNESVGPIPLMVVGRYGEGPRDLTSRASYITDHAYVDPEVTCELITREHVIRPPYLQLNDGIQCSIKPNEDLAISTDFVVDDGFKTFTRDKRVSSQGFRMGSSPTDSANDVLHNKATRLAIYPTSRWAGTQNRFRLYDTAGYVIDSWNRYLAVDYGTSFPTAAWLATIATGVYTRDDLLTALQTAINAGRPGGSPAWTVAINGSGFGNFSVNAPGAQRIAICFTANGVITAAQAASSLRLAAYLAMDTSNADRQQSGAGPGVVNITGRLALFKKAATNFELYGLQAQFEVYDRTP